MILSIKGLLDEGFFQLVHFVVRFDDQLVVFLLNLVILELVEPLLVESSERGGPSLRTQVHTYRPLRT